MIPITRSTSFYFLQDIPLDTTYRNTIYWRRRGSQTSYFQDHAAYQTYGCSYQRIGGADFIRAPINAEDLYLCNYVMFKNAPMGDKWFYAFITSVEFINPETSFVGFEIDVMQTYHFDYQLMDSFVLREHTGTDKPGDNLIPDTPFYDETQYKFIELMPQFTNPRQIVVEATFDRDLNDAVGGMYGGIYSGLEYILFGSQTDLNPWLLKVAQANKINGIVSIYMTNTSFISEKNTNEPEKFIHGYQRMYTDLNGYVPRNKKMFTYPYYYLMITDNEGTCNEYRWEYFSVPENNDCQFEVYGTMGSASEIILIPLQYKGSERCFPEKMILSGYPQVSWASDSYAAWLSQHTAGNTMRLLNNMWAIGTGLAEVYVGAATPESLANIGGGIGDLVDMGIDNYNAKKTPNQAHAAGGSTINMAIHNKGFSAYRAMPSQYWCNILDNYWDMYGYPIQTVKRPNRSVRPHWNYLKTQGVNLVGSVPAYEMQKIASIYDRGITFWNDGDEVGLYELDNSPDGAELTSEGGGEYEKEFIEEYEKYRGARIEHVNVSNVRRATNAASHDSI